MTTHTETKWIVAHDADLQEFDTKREALEAYREERPRRRWVKVTKQTTVTEEIRVPPQEQMQ